MVLQPQSLRHLLPHWPSFVACLNQLFQWCSAVEFCHCDTCQVLFGHDHQLEIILWSPENPFFLHIFSKSRLSIYIYIERERESFVVSRLNCFSCSPRFKGTNPMKETWRYLAGIAGPSGYGSNSTAEQVIQDSACLVPPHLTAIITG